MAIVTDDGEAPDSADLDATPLPGIAVSAGALIFDRAGLVILKPTYKSGWTIPGGVMEADGESPWEACRREVREETGLDVSRGRLAAMDFRRPKRGLPGRHPVPVRLRSCERQGAGQPDAAARGDLRVPAGSGARRARPAQRPDQAAGAGGHPRPANGLPGGRPPGLSCPPGRPAAISRHMRSLKKCIVILAISSWSEVTSLQDSSADGSSDNTTSSTMVQYPMAHAADATRRACSCLPTPPAPWPPPPALAPACAGR